MMKQIGVGIVVSITLFFGNAAFGQCCTCEGDVNGDGVLVPLFGDDDAAIVLACFQGDQSACALCTSVPNCDVDCNGLQNIDDVFAMTCIFQSGGQTSNLSCCPNSPTICECDQFTPCTGTLQCIDGECGLPGSCCTCDGDLDGSGTVDSADDQLLADCMNAVPGACANCVVPGCDVNCDGVLSVDDTDAVTCMDQAGGASPDLSCCGGGRGGLALCECNVDSDCTGDLRCLDNACSNAVPAVSEWGMILLVLVVLAAGSVTIRRRAATARI